MSLNAISPLGAQSPTVLAPSAASPAAAARSSQAQAAPPSSQVTLQAVSKGGLVYAPPAPMPTVSPVWETRATDAISLRMSGNLEAGSAPASRFDGLGAALLGRLKTDGSDFSQSVFQYQTGRKPSAGFNSLTQAQLHQFADNRITLQVTTRSGAQVEISLGSQDEGLAVQIQVTGGALTSSEREALGALSGAFQNAIDGLAEVPPRLALDGLTQFDSSALSSVDLNASFKLGNGEAQTIAFHADLQQRSLTASGPSGKVQVSVDMSNAQIQGSAQQQAQALDNYLQQFDHAQSRGRGDAALMGLFEDAFTQLHSHYPASAAGMQARTGGIELNDTDHGMLSGLADFSASVSETPASVNPMRPDEVDGFSYRVSQASSIRGSGRLDRAITQRQDAHLSASFHTGLTPGAGLQLTTDKRSQNYNYTRIDDSASSQVDIAYDQGNLVKAMLTQSASQSTQVQKYEKGNLVSDTTTPLQQARSQNLLDLLGATIGKDDDHREADLSRIRNLVLLQADPRLLN